MGVTGFLLQHQWSRSDTSAHPFITSKLLQCIYDVEHPIQALQIIAFAAHAIIKHTIFLVLPVSCRYSVFVNTAFLWNIVPYAELTFSLLSFVKPYIYFLLRLTFLYHCLFLIFVFTFYFCFIYSIDHLVLVLLYLCFRKHPCYRLCLLVTFNLLQIRYKVIITLDPESPLMFIVSIATIISEFVWSEIWCTCTHSQIFNLKLFNIVLIIVIQFFDIVLLCK